MSLPEKFFPSKGMNWLWRITYKAKTTLLCKIQSRPALPLSRVQQHQGHNVILVPVYWLVSSKKGTAKNYRYTQISLLIYHAEWMNGKKKQLQEGTEFSMKQTKSLFEHQFRPGVHLIYIYLLARPEEQC